jgi:hypothetical protein
MTLRFTPVDNINEARGYHIIDKLNNVDRKFIRLYMGAFDMICRMNDNEECINVKITVEASSIDFPTMYNYDKPVFIVKHNEDLEVNNEQYLELFMVQMKINDVSKIKNFLGEKFLEYTNLSKDKNLKKELNNFFEKMNINCCV